MKLTNAKIKILTIGKKHSDGAGLYLLLSKRQQGKWSYRFMLHNKSHEMGLGQYPLISLTKARQLRDQYRLLKDQGQILSLKNESVRKKQVSVERYSIHVIIYYMQLKSDSKKNLLLEFEYGRIFCLTHYKNVILIIYSLNDDSEK